MFRFWNTCAACCAKLPLPTTAGLTRKALGAVQPKEDSMHVLNIVTSPRKDQSASRALVDAFLREYMRQADDIVVDTLDVWQEWLPEFDAETINAKY